MPRHARSLRSVPLGLVLLTCGAGSVPGAEPSPPEAMLMASAANGTDANLAEMIRSYLALRDQLHTLQLSMLQQRLDAEIAARTQGTLAADKFEAIKTVIEAEREFRRQEYQRSRDERESLNRELAGLQRNALWLSGAMFVLGLAASTLLRRFRIASGPHAAPATAPEPGPARPATIEPSSPVRTVPMVQTVTTNAAAEPVLPAQPAAQPAARPRPDMPPPPAKQQGAPASIPAHDALDQPRPDPASIAGLLAKGNSLLMESRAREALSCFEELLQFDQDNTEAWLKRGLALERLQQFDSALRSFDQAISLEPGLATAHLHRAGLCTRLKRFDDAAESYRRAAQGTTPLSQVKR